ncbi:MAG TPA: hypothetical protein VGV57_07995 [Thermoleophilaceae bacterium]|nr:hypothetical protein [Thermoleophilaceae bacterium]
MWVVTSQSQMVRGEGAGHPAPSVQGSGQCGHSAPAVPVQLDVLGE